MVITLAAATGLGARVEEEAILGRELQASSARLRVDKKLNTAQSLCELLLRLLGYLR